MTRIVEAMESLGIGIVGGLAVYYLRSYLDKVRFKIAKKYLKRSEKAEEAFGRKVQEYLRKPSGNLELMMQSINSCISLAIVGLSIWALVITMWANWPLDVYINGINLMNLYFILFGIFGALFFIYLKKYLSYQRIIYEVRYCLEKERKEKEESQKDHEYAHPL